jgi:hypothetical protein
MSHTSNLADSETATNYVAPSVKVLGTVANLTEGGNMVNSDNGLAANNAFGNPS